MTTDTTTFKTEFPVDSGIKREIQTSAKYSRDDRDKDEYSSKFIVGTIARDLNVHQETEKVGDKEDKVGIQNMETSMTKFEILGDGELRMGTSGNAQMSEFRIGEARGEIETPFTRGCQFKKLEQNSNDSGNVTAPVSRRAQ